MHSFLLSSEQDLANFLKHEKFEKIFILSGKKSYVGSGAKKILNKYLKNCSLVSGDIRNKNTFSKINNRIDLVYQIIFSKYLVITYLNFYYLLIS